MKPKRIILLRHGESEANVDKGLYADTPDHLVDLTIRGEEQCKQVGLHFKEYLADKNIVIWSSPYKRSRRTSEIVTNYLDDKKVVYKEDPRLREQEWGNFYTQDEALRKKEDRKRHSYFFYRIDNGESGADVYDRISTFLDTLYQDFTHDTWTDTIIISTHGITALIFLMRFFHWKYEEYENSGKLDNCGYVILELDDKTGRYVITEDQRK